MLKIQTWGGWGDVLRELSLLPVSALHRHLKIQTRIQHLPLAGAGLHHKAQAPDPEAVRLLLQRVPALSWIGTDTVPKHSKALARAARLLLEKVPGQNRLFLPEFKWRPEDKLPETFNPRFRNLVIQTHLSGLPSKAWPLAAWRETLISLRKSHPGWKFHILDPYGAELAMQDVVIHDSLSFPRALRMVSSCSCVIAVDSWSKYVASWHGIPQLVIVPDQSSDYAQLTASAIWKYSFKGLHHNSSLHLLGLQPLNSSQARHTFGSILNLQVEDVLREGSAVLLSPAFL